MVPNDDMRLYEPEGIEPDTRLQGEAELHLSVHRALIDAGQEWKKRAPFRQSDDFDRRLLERLERDGRSAPVDDRDFAPVAGAGEAPFFNRRGFLAATAAIFFVSFGVLWFEAYRDYGRKEVPLPSAQSGEGQQLNEAPAKEKSLSQAPAFPAQKKGSSDGMPAPAQPSVDRDRFDEKRLSAPSGPQKESEIQSRSAWSEDALPDGEALLKDQIAGESNPVKKKELLQQLLKLYEARGQKQKAAEIRHQIQTQ